MCNCCIGRKNYPKIGDLGSPEMPPRLFKISDASTGGIGVHTEEIFDFGQGDLDERDVMMLDAFREVFHLIG